MNVSLMESLNCLGVCKDAAFILCARRYVGRSSKFIFGDNCLALDRHSTQLIEKLLLPVTEAEYYRKFFKQPLNLLKNYTYTGLMFCMLFESMPVKRTSLKWPHLENVLERIFVPRYEIYLCLSDKNDWNVYLCSAVL